MVTVSGRNEVHYRNYGVGNFREDKYIHHEYWTISGLQVDENYIDSGSNTFI